MTLLPCAVQRGVNVVVARERENIVKSHNNERTILTYVLIPLALPWK